MKAKKNIYLAIYICLIIISLILLIVSSIYFTRISFNVNNTTEFWIKFLWLSLIIISSSCLFTNLCLLLENIYLRFKGEPRCKQK